MVTTKNLVIDQGTTFNEYFVYKDQDKNIVPLNGYTVYAQMQKSYDSVNASAIFNATLIDAGNGNVRLNLTATDTANLSGGRYVYRLDANIGANVVRIAEGSVTVISAAMATGIPSTAGSYIITLVNSAVANLNLTTANISENLSNLYFTNSRVYANISPLLDLKANVSDLSNLTAYVTRPELQANVTSINTNLILKANISDLSLYATNADFVSNVNIINANLILKANISDLNNYVRTTVYQSNIDLKANLAALSNYSLLTSFNANIANITTNINLRANRVDLTTSNVIELTNLYFTNTRVSAVIANVTSHVAPSAPNIYTLGLSSAPFFNVWLSSNANVFFGVNRYLSVQNSLLYINGLPYYSANGVANSITSLSAPTTAGDSGNPGDIRYDNDYIYICISANTWKRANLLTW